MTDTARIDKSERIKQLKEVLRKKHETETEFRLKSIDDSEPFNRFSKYRRSHGSRPENHVSGLMTRSGPIIPNEDDRAYHKGSPISSYQCSYEALVPTQPICAAVPDFLPEITSGNVHDLKTSFETGQNDAIGTFENMTSPFYAKREIHKKPNTPLILQPREKLTDDHENAATRRKQKPSILKKKDENHSSGGASVSFDLDTVISGLIVHTKSTEGNHSTDTETGNLSTRILKTRLTNLQNDNDHKFGILKDRRSSLGSANSSPESSLHGILKRKLSYDSSTLIHCANANSLSTNSLDCVSPEPKPILKKKSSSEDLEETEWISRKPILKKNSLRGDHSHSSSSDGLDDGAIRPILKKSIQVEEKLWDFEGPSQSGRSILKRMGNKNSSNYYSMEDSICDTRKDRFQAETGYSGPRHGSLPNPENSGYEDLNTLSIQKMERNLRRTDSEEEIIMGLNVAEKRSIFLQMERESGYNRMHKRHATQPVTLEEIERASQLIEQQISAIPSEQLKSNIMNEPKELLGTMLGELSQRNAAAEAHGSSGQKLGAIPRSSSIGSSSALPRAVSPVKRVDTTETLTLFSSSVATASSSEEDPSKLTLQERVRMFNNFARTPSPVSYTRSAKRLVTSRRFQTQPVTSLEHLLIQDCFGSGPRDVKEFVPDAFDLQSAKDEEQLDCVGVLSDEPSHLSQDEMREKLEWNDGARPGSSNEDDRIDHDEEKSFLKKRVKSPNYEIGEMEEDAVLCEKSGSIAAKIAALKTNGEMNWKKRICKPIIKKVLVDEADNHRNIEIAANNKDSPSVVANRLCLLEKSQAGWKQRVSENDATHLTVQSKLEKAGKLKESSTLTERKSKEVNILKPITFASKSNKTPALKAELEKRVQNIGKKLPLPQLSSVPKPLEEGSSSEERVTRSVSSNDNEEFRSFFPSVTAIGSPSHAPVTNISLDEIQVGERQFLGVRRNVRVNRSHAAVRNPIKTLASRLQEQTYTELKPEVREKELKKRIQVENLSKTSHLSIEALAALASKEDFTAVRLKRADSERRNQEIPYPMLIRIKGKRFVQTRIVPPLVSSLSSGDCFILITKDRVYQYIGEFSNRMERSKLADILTHLVQKRDLGTHLSSVLEVITIEEPILMDRRDVKNFFKILGSDIPVTLADEKLGDEADEEYESGVIRTNRVFEVDSGKQELIPVLSEGGWGSQPKFSMLKEDRVLVFDFGSEMYVWSGVRAEPELKQAGSSLAREMFEDSYNFSEVGHEFSPLGSLVIGDKRPSSWCWLKRVTPHMEPILFVEKFFDWPDESGKFLRVKSVSESSGKDGGFNYSPCDIDEMLDAVNNIEDPTLELETFNVSRGLEVHDEKENRHYTITTLDVNVWRISEFAKTAVDSDSVGHFYSTETYVVRWHYTVMQIGRDLKGNQSKYGGVIGRPRTAYFFWHGRDSKATEQGSSALLTIELDEEKAPQVRVVQGREPPAFLALFGGHMFIHLGSPEDCRQKNQRLYVTMGCVEGEGHFVEVPSQPSSFRSRGSFLIVDKETGHLCVWHGCHSSTVTQKIAQNGAKYISSSPLEFYLPKVFRLAELKEGEETKELWERMGVKTEMEWRESYTSLRAQTGSSSSQMTVFYFTSLNGVLEAKPLLSPKRKTDAVQSFPVLQEELYNVRQQPALFLVMQGSDAWLWHGWIPRGDEENENTSTGSGEYRWAAERKAALETGVEMVKRINGRGHIVYAGLEPPLFRCLFPYWSIHQEARDCNLAEGKSVDGALSFTAALETFRKKKYTLEELQERPEGVDLLRLENYLCDSEFENLVKMSRQDFNKLQQWKKDEIKKQVGLF